MSKSIRDGIGYQVKEECFTPKSNFAKTIIDTLMQNN